MLFRSYTTGATVDAAAEALRDAGAAEVHCMYMCRQRQKEEKKIMEVKNCKGCGRLFNYLGGPRRDPRIKDLFIRNTSATLQCAPLGRGRRVFARLDAEDDKWYYFSLAYIPRVLNNRGVNNAIVQMFFIGKWRVHKLSLWAEPEDINHYGNDSNKTFYHLVNR